MATAGLREGVSIICLATQEWEIRLPSHDRVMPLFEVWIVVKHRLSLVTHQEVEHHVPRHERKIGIGAFVSDEVSGSIGLEVVVQDADDPFDLVGVAVDGRCEPLLLVEECEPRLLSEIWSLTRNLQFSC